jgi:hypothetical protein
VERNGANNTIDPDRLMEAVDAIYEALEELQSEGLPLRYPVDLMGSPNQPECLCDFTRFEIAEASKFLERAGLMVRRRRPGGMPWGS